MRFVTLLPVLTFLGAAAVAAQNSSWINSSIDLDIVRSHVSSFARENNETIGNREAPSGCALAVSWHKYRFRHPSINTKQCSFLKYVLPTELSYPDDPAYQYEESQYWSVQQATTQPACRLSPTESLYISIAILAAQVTNCEFAVKSGGHAAFYGASNINNGLTIDLIELNQVTVSADHKQTSIGSGNRWYDVYTQLEPQGLAVIGGRVSDIGVGGLTLGGGISFFSGTYGWACDNVNNYEVCLECPNSTPPDFCRLCSQMAQSRT